MLRRAQKFPRRSLHPRRTALLARLRRYRDALDAEAASVDRLVGELERAGRAAVAHPRSHVGRPLVPDLVEAVMAGRTMPAKEIVAAVRKARPRASKYVRSQVMRALADQRRFRRVGWGMYESRVLG